MDSKKDRILIIRFSSLGDIILTASVIQQLRKIYPKAEIDYLTKPIFEPLISSYFPINQVFTEYKSYHKLKELKRRNYTLVIDLHNKLNSWIAKKIICGEKRVTYDKKRRLRKKIVAHKTTLSINSSVDLYNSVFDKLKIPYTFIEPNIKIESEAQQNLLPSKNKLNVVIFPGATHNTKRVPKHILISFINNYEHYDTSFFFLGSKSEKELTQEIAQKCKKECFDLAGKFNLVELVAAINEADIVISNDSGPMHIAAALGKPQIAFFGSTNVSLGFRPLNENAIVITNPIQCSPCTLHGRKECPLKHFACMENISTNSIYEAYKELINRHCGNI